MGPTIMAYLGLSDIQSRPFDSDMKGGLNRFGEDSYFVEFDRVIFEEREKR